jgi:uncharacterized membrane protein
MTGMIRSERSAGGTARDRSTVDRLTNGLGWFSIGLGLAEVAAPGAVASLIGVRDTPKTRTVLRLYGVRELAAGIGIMTQLRPAGWLWARVAGDAVDLTSLASAFGGRGNRKAKVALSMASVLGVTAADVYCARRLGQGAGRRPNKVVRTIIVDRPADEAYRLWHDFQNLPRFMKNVESVRYTGDRRTHWVAEGPGGARIEWDAETLIDEPNRLIAWRSAEGSPIQISGSVRFERAPGDRGTLVRLELEYLTGGAISAVGKLLQLELTRRVSEDLRRFKQVLEVGEVIESEASIHPGMHPAQPEPVYQH